MTENIIPVILSGGTGTRLWPLSRQSHPKQLLALAGERTLLQDTALRAGAVTAAAPLVIARVDHRFMVAEQLRGIGISAPRIVLEPVGRNTAPAVAVAALMALEREPDSVLLVMPADHIIGDNASFAAMISEALPAAREGAFVLFGVIPTHPETGYGYIRSGRSLTDHGAVRQATAFVEKPDATTAEAYVKSGQYLWNSGIFLFRADAIVRELETLIPEVMTAARIAVAGATRDLDFVRLDERFAASPSISIDRAVMERTDRAAVLPVDFTWSDVGSWSALWGIEEKDPRGNVHIGSAISVSATNGYFRSNGPLLAAVGVDDVIVVATPDAVLVTRRSCDQLVSSLVERLKNDGVTAAMTTARVHRPWGFFETVDAGERFQVKRIMVNSGARLSLQKHRHRAEHWVVVNGQALVTRDGEQVVLHENESIFLPLGCVHRLENPGTVPLNLIEVQSGDYLGEDDIVRIEDDFGRVP